MHEPGTDAPEVVEPEAEAVGDTGPEGLDDDVDPGGDPEHRVAAGRARDVEHNAALVAVDGEEDGALAAPPGWEAAGRLTGPRPLDLDYVGAEVGEDEAGERAGDVLAEIEHPVLELTITIAGPYCAMILADLGADVVKVERPGGGDDARSMPPHRGTDSAVFHAVNRTKRSVVLDLKTPAGREAFLRLADTADVVVQSYRPGAADALGVGAEVVLARNPVAVYCSVSAFGDAGAAAGLPGYDPLIQAFSGLMSMTGEHGGPPVRVAASLIDLTTGMWAAMAVMAALRRRETTGVGEHVGATLVDSGFALLGHQIVGMYATGEVPGPLGSASPITAPYETFATSDGWVMIAAGNDGLFARLCGALELPELLADARFAGSASRVQHRDALHAAVEQRTARLGTAACIDVLRAAGVPVGPVHDLRQAVEHPVTVERGIVVDDGAGGLPSVRLPIADAARPSFHRPPPRLGEHTAQVLAEAGFGPEEIRTLLDAGPGRTP